MRFIEWSHKRSHLDLSPVNILPWDVTDVLTCEPQKLNIDPMDYCRVMGFGDGTMDGADIRLFAERLLVKSLRRAVGMSETTASFRGFEGCRFAYVQSLRQDAEEVVETIVRQTIADLSAPQGRVWALIARLGFPTRVLRKQDLLPKLQKVVENHWSTISRDYGWRLSYSESTAADRLEVTLHAVRRRARVILQRSLGLDRSANAFEIAQALLRSQSAESVEA